MIVVVCDSWEDANYAYESFLSFLMTYNSFGIWEKYDCSLCVHLESSPISPPLPKEYFIFIPYQVQNYNSLRFDVSKHELVDCGTFFDELCSMEEEFLTEEGE